MTARFRVVAIRIPEDSGPVEEAILADTRHPRRGLMSWWGGYGWETLSRDTTLPHLLEADPTLRVYEMDLPKDWQEGSLVLQGDEVRFVRARKAD